MSNINTTLEVLGITDTHVHINGYRHENHSKGTGRKKFLVIQAVLTYQLARCPECGFEALYPNGHIKTRIHINSANDRPV
ncbi:ISL3 family transposase, partial [Secundilactobacillus hailunensis]